MPRSSAGIVTAIIPRRFKTPVGIGIAGAVGAGIIGKELFGNGNAARLGRVTYDAGPARMTKAYSSGAVETMMKESGGNYAAFADMAEEVVHGHGNVFGRVLDDYGADSKLISALYNMGGQ